MKPFAHAWLVLTLAAYFLVLSPVAAQNLAFGQPAIASSAVQPASYAFDGNGGTRWESSSSDPQYIIVDLGSVQSIDRIRLTWETALGKNFTLDISTITDAPSDASWTNVVSGTWTNVQTTMGNAATTNEYQHLGQNGRYVRMLGTARGTVYGYSLFEFAVYAYDPNSNPNLALGKVATTSSSPAQAATNAFDGDGTTRWESASSDPQFITVDLGSVQPIDRIRLSWETALGKDFTLDISSDNTAWQTAVTVTGNTSYSNEYANLGKSGRYVRMNGTARGTGYGYSLFEFEVFATSNNAVNLANGKPGVASSTQGALIANNAFDNDRTTRWASSAGSDNASVYVDLGVQTTISRVYLVWEQAYGGSFTIDVSNDTNAWTTVASTIGNNLRFNEYNLAQPATGRYVRMNGTKRGNTSASSGYSLYEFQVNGPQTLPVTLTSFSAVPRGTGVAVSWSTASEQQNAGFEVQRSATGIDTDFTTLATVAGVGTTQSKHSYSYFDTAPLGAVGYYRLKQLNTDGTIAYSPVVPVQPAATGSATSPSIYPNPTTGRATATWATPLVGASRWYLTNTIGQMVHAEALSAGAATTLTLDLRPYPVGSYVLTVEAGGKVVCRTRVQKAN